MTKKILGKKCPKFTAESTGGKNISSEDFLGKNQVIYFYPKDSTQAVQQRDKNLEILISNLSHRIQKYWEFQETQLSHMRILRLSKIFHLSFCPTQMKKYVRRLM